MDDENGGGDPFAGQSGTPGATVSISADVKPWEAALDRASAKMTAWGGKITSVIDKASAYNEAKINQWGKSLDKLAELDSGQLGTKLGDKIGQVVGAGLGTFLGPGVGTMIGKELGGAIGGELGNQLAKIDTKDIFGSLSKVLSPVQDVIDTIKDAWQGIGFDADMTFREIKKLLRDIDFKGILTGDFDAAWAGMLKAGDAVFEKIRDLGVRMAFRIANAIQNVFELVKEPVARLADMVQELLVKWGVLESGTNSWGDSIRTVGDISKTVFGAILQAIGHIEGALTNVVGAFQVTFGVALLKGISMYFSMFREALLKLEPLAKKHLSKEDYDRLEGAEMWFGAQASDAASEALRLRAKGIDNLNVSGKELAEKYKKQLDELWEKSKLTAEMQDEIRAWIKESLGDLAAIADMNIASGAGTGAAAIEKAGSVSSKAILERSQEAANLIATQGGGASYETVENQRWEKAYEKSSQQIQLLQAIKDALDQERLLVDIL